MYKRICKYIFEHRFGLTAVTFTLNEILSCQKMSDNESSRRRRRRRRRRSEMKSSIQRAVERSFSSSQKLIIDEATRVVEERLRERSRGITYYVIKES